MKTITYYQYKNNLYGFCKINFIDKLILQRRFIEENAQAVKCDNHFSIISKRK